MKVTRKIAIVLKTNLRFWTNGEDVDLSFDFNFRSFFKLGFGADATFWVICLADWIAFEVACLVVSLRSFFSGIFKS